MPPPPRVLILLLPLSLTLCRAVPSPILSLLPATGVRRRRAVPLSISSPVHIFFVTRFVRRRRRQRRRRAGRQLVLPRLRLLLQGRALRESVLEAFGDSTMDWGTMCLCQHCERMEGKGAKELSWRAGAQHHLHCRCA